MLPLLLDKSFPAHFKEFIDETKHFQMKELFFVDGLELLYKALSALSPGILLVVFGRENDPAVEIVLEAVDVVEHLVRLKSEEQVLAELSFLLEVISTEDEEVGFGSADREFEKGKFVEEGA